MLTVNQQTIPLGKIKKGESKHFNYILTNKSDESLRIENISVGCGSCTIASTDKSVIEAKGTTKINVIFTPNSSGVQLKTVYVHYNGTKLQLKFSAEVYG